MNRWVGHWKLWQQETVRTHNVHCRQFPPTSPLPCPPIASFYNYSWWWLKTNSRRTFISWWRSSVRDGDDRSSLMAVWQRHELVRTQTSKLWAMMGACLIPDANGHDGQTRRWWDAALMWPLKGISSFFWWRQVSGLASTRHLRLVGIKPMVGDCLWWHMW